MLIIIKRRALGEIEVYLLFIAEETSESEIILYVCPSQALRVTVVMNERERFICIKHVNKGTII